jgi:hypothetical protein
VFTGALLRLPPLPVLAGAALAGLPGLIGVALDAHWLGPPFGVVLFALWCGRLAAAGRQRPGTVVI